MSGQTIEDPEEMINEFRTDRTQVNAKKWIQVIKENLKWAKQNGIELIVRTNDVSGQALYLAHTTRKGKPCKKTYSYLTSKPNLQSTAWYIQDLAVLIQDIHLFEFANIKNKQTIKLNIEVFDNCFECGMSLDDPSHKVDDTPYQNCLCVN